MSESGGRIVVVSLTLIIIVVILVAVFSAQKQKLDTTLPGVPTPTDSLLSSTGPEPEIAEWKKFTNEQYHFSITYPEKWYVQDFQELHPAGGTLIAFGPDELPCGNCSYNRNGYLSLKVYNEKTDPELYAFYTMRVKAIGKSKDYRQVSFNNLQGVATDTTVTLEHNGWVYEFTLDKNNGSAKVDTAPIFQKIVSSLSFANEGLL